MKSALLFIGIALVMGGAFFVLAIMTTYTTILVHNSRFEPIELVFICFLVGLVEVLVGYESIVVFGGRFSLGVAEFVSRLAGTRQVIEVRGEAPKELKHRLIRGLFLAYVPLIVFVILVAIAWDLYTADSVHSGILRPLFHQLDIFSRPPVGVNVILYSIEVMPYVVLFSALAGIVPSISIPYFRKFKVTGVNSGPFHTTFMIGIVGVVGGISALITLTGLFYEVLLLSKFPIYYHFILLFAAGISLYYGVGSYLGLERAEEMIRRELANKKGRNVVEGTVTLTPR